MESWSIHQYENPYLDAEFSSQGECLEITSQGESFEIQASSLDGCDILRLINPRDECWQLLLSGKKESELGDLVEQMDELGIIREENQSLDHLQTFRRRVDSLVFEALEILNQHDEEIDEKILESIWIDLNNVRKGEFSSNEVVNEHNFYLAILKGLFCSWKYSNSFVLEVVSRILEEVLNKDVGNHTLEIGFVIKDQIKEIQECVTSFVWCVCRSQGKDSERHFFREDILIDCTDTGLNLGITSEKLARDCLDAVSSSPYMKALYQPEHQAVLARATYIQEYFINERFVEIIAPAIAKKLPLPLKALFRRYYAEEIGHEAFERQTCITLGVNCTDLDSMIPLPLTQAFCDVFTWLANEEVLAYFLSIVITEGLPGEKNIINSVLASSSIFPDDVNRASLEHEDLNDELNHQMISRLVLSQISYVSEAEQERAIKLFLLVLELNCRAWDELYRHHVEEKRPLCPMSMRAFFTTEN
ncbi:hypothetical protein LRP50_01085 [Enterovibrio sp. ZSDZ42]|uniref:Iron-containing redox enzyme family protein n=1 Tax=Enterovibrio gelatinilyticus TaxID=2899819 RepID=A0ABT5QUQ1_9GAMM|nr:hypothetical protein [Enterovibrio sp. ZSDZ42]MDD1791723.1 hypothetical protein [Enterovibrio sp. ZSDZ42]